MSLRRLVLASSACAAFGALAAPALAHDHPADMGHHAPAWKADRERDYNDFNSHDRDAWLEECERRLDRRSARERCEVYLEDYYARARHGYGSYDYGQGYGYAMPAYGYGGGCCQQPMMMVPIMRREQSEPECTTTVEYEYVDVPVRAKPRPAPVPQKRVKVVPDKRIKTVPEKRIPVK